MTHEKKILVVDDDEFMQELFKIYLGLEGFQVLSCQDSVDAIKMVLNNNPDLIILDLAMPVIDGMKLLHMIRNEEGLQIPILICSSFMPRDMQSRVQNPEITDFLEKPFEPEDLVSKINALVK